MKKIGELGLKTVYRSRKSEAGQWMRKCFGLPGICIDSVTEFFNDHFVKTAPLSKCPKLQKFINYLNRNYMRPNSLYPPKLWAGICTTDLKTSTNSVESWHQKFGEFFNSRKGNPNIYEFLERLNDNHMYAMMKGEDCQETKDADAKLEYLRNLHDRLLKKEITIDAFLFSVRRKKIPKAKPTTRKSQRVKKKRIVGNPAKRQCLDSYWSL